MSLCKSVCVYEEGPADMPEELMNNPPSPSGPSCPSHPCQSCHIATPLATCELRKNDAHVMGDQLLTRSVCCASHHRRPYFLADGAQPFSTSLSWYFSA